MKLFIARLFAVILIAVSIIDACAWSGPGHMTVAAIAYRDLSPVERQKFDAILESHPQFQSWQNDFPENVPNLDQGLYVAMVPAYRQTRSVITMILQRSRIGILLTTR